MKALALLEEYINPTGRDTYTVRDTTTYGGAQLTGEYDTKIQVAQLLRNKIKAYTEYNNRHNLKIAYRIIEVDVIQSVKQE